MRNSVQILLLIIIICLCVYIFKNDQKSKKDPDCPSNYRSRSGYETQVSRDRGHTPLSLPTPKPIIRQQANPYTLGGITQNYGVTLPTGMALDILQNTQPHTQLPFNSFQN